MKLTKEFLDGLRPEINAALATVANKHGIGIKLGNGTFNESTASFKLNFSAEADVSPEMMRARLDWVRYSFELDAEGVSRDLLGKTVKHRSGKVYKIEGFLPRSKAFPILARDPSGQTFKLSYAIVKNSELVG